jgi:hypothetical protein
MAHSSSAIDPAHLQANLDILREGRYHQTLRRSQGPARGARLGATSKRAIADIGCWDRMVFMSEGGFEVADWPHLEAWAGHLKAMPGFALSYDLIPSKDREFDPV